MENIDNSQPEGTEENQKSRLLVVNGLDNDAQIDVYFAGSRGEGLWSAGPPPILKQRPGRGHNLTLHVERRRRQDGAARRCKRSVHNLVATMCLLRDGKKTIRVDRVRQRRGSRNI